MGIVIDGLSINDQKRRNSLNPIINIYVIWWMSIYYASDLIHKLSDEVYEYFLLPLLKSENCYHWRLEAYILKEVKPKLPH